MLYFNLVEISDKPGQAFIDGLIPSLVCIIIVFVILALIYGIVAVLNKIKALDVKEEIVSEQPLTSAPKTLKVEDIEDEDMMAAVLVATIDYQNQTKQDVRLVSVKKIG